MATAEYQAEYRRKWREENPDKAKRNMERSSERRKMRSMENQDRQPEVKDLLISTIQIQLTGEQEDFLSLYMDEPRSVLFLTFRKRFNSTINKLQFNQALHTMKEKPSPENNGKHTGLGTRRPNVPKVQNVYWIELRCVWSVQFKREKSRIIIGYYDDYEKAKAIAEEYRTIHGMGRKSKCVR